VGGGKTGAARVSTAGLSKAGWTGCVEVKIGVGELAAGAQEANKMTNKIRRIEKRDFDTISDSVRETK
jgi:hypothetical protein